MAQKTINELLVGSQSLAEFTTFVHSAIHVALILGEGNGRSYEGTVALILPSFHEMQGPNPRVKIELSCYTLGPSRHYSWEGNNVSECISSAKISIDRWVKEVREEVIEVKTISLEEAAEEGQTQDEATRNTNTSQE